MFTFEIGSEVENVQNALETKTVGEDTVSGRKTSILEITPNGGAPYRLWIDKETRLPLQKQSSMQNAIQYTVTYTEIKFMNDVPAELTAYNLPDGYQEIDTNPEQLVSDMQEAGNMAGLIPKVPYSVPEGYNLDSIAVTADKMVKLNYAAKDKKSRVIFLQGKAQDDFKPASKAVLGKLNNHVVEIQSPVEGNSGILTGGGTYAGVTNITSMRWQENGFEFAVVGNASLEGLTIFVNSLANGVVQIPQEGADLLKKPQVDVPVDMEIEKNEQKSVDAGHSPWKLDPAFVAQVFVSLKISPEGITGDYPIKYEDLKVIQNIGTTAVVEVAGGNTPVSRVYLKRLIRQDSTGIWTVVGYDPAEE